MKNKDVLNEIKKDKGDDGSNFLKHLEKLFQRVKERLKKRIKDNRIFSEDDFKGMVIYKERKNRYLSSYLLEMSTVFIEHYKKIVDRSQKMEGPLNKKII